MEKIVGGTLAVQQAAKIEEIEEKQKAQEQEINGMITLIFSIHLDTKIFFYRNAWINKLIKRLASLKVWLEFTWLSESIKATAWGNNKCWHDKAGVNNDKLYLKICAKD